MSGFRLWNLHYCVCLLVSLTTGMFPWVRLSCNDLHILATTNRYTRTYIHTYIQPLTPVGGCPFHLTCTNLYAYLFVCLFVCLFGCLWLFCFCLFVYLWLVCFCLVVCFVFVVCLFVVPFVSVAWPVVCRPVVLSRWLSAASLFVTFCCRTSLHRYSYRDLPF